MQYLRLQPATRPTSDAEEPTTFVPAYDIAGNLLFQHSMDAGDRWVLNDAAGKPMLAWDFNQRQDSGGAFVNERRQSSTSYDALHRPIAQSLLVNAGSPRIVERWEYVDAASPAPFAVVADAQERNLCGQLHRHFDPGGLVQVERLDFTGMPLEEQRQLTTDHTAAVTDWRTDPQSSVDGETFIKITEYDALKRVTRLYNWHRLTTIDKRVAVYEPVYNERGLLASEQLVVHAARNGATSGRRYDEGPATERNDAIVAISYDARGQRLSLKLGSGTTTQYDYDPQTFRLRQLRTTRRVGGQADPSFPGFASNHADPRVLQQLIYAYDPVGNITSVEDQAYRPVYWDGGIAEPESLYEYDPLYRLIWASGRETAQGGASAVDGTDPPIAQGFPITDQTLRQYIQTYQYDPVGNFLLMKHTVKGDPAAGWTRHYESDLYSNRLHYTWTGSSRFAPLEYLYDAHGNTRNLARVAPTSFLRWDHRDMISSVNLGGGGTVYYQYDAGKQRTRKRIDNQSGGGHWERIDLGGYELYRRYTAASATPMKEIETLHLLDGHQRLLMVDQALLTTSGGPGTTNLYRYTLSNHLGSSTVELDDDGRIISTEEYHPYGSTAYRAGGNAAEVKLKRYRYTGMEKDDETGLHYHGARQYASHLGRWASYDPLPKRAHSPYEYSSCRPTLMLDRTGLAETPSTDAIAEDAYRQALVETFSTAGGAVLVSDPLKSVDANGLDAVVVVGKGHATQVVLGDAKHAQFAPGSKDPGLKGKAINATGKEAGPGLISSFETAKKHAFADVIADIKGAEQAGKLDPDTAAEAIASLKRGEAHFNIGVSGYNVDIAESVHRMYDPTVIRYDQFAEATSQRADVEATRAVRATVPKLPTVSTSEANKIVKTVGGGLEERAAQRAEAVLAEQGGAKLTEHVPVVGMYIALGVVETDLNRKDYVDAPLDLVGPIPVVGELALGLQIGIAVGQDMIEQGASAAYNVAKFVLNFGDVGFYYP